MVYGIIKLTNVAHGEIYMMGAFFALTFLSAGHIPFSVAFLLSVACSGLLGVLIDMGAYRPLRGAPRLSAQITAIGVSLFLQNLARARWGAWTKPFPSGYVPDFFKGASAVGGVTITNLQIFIFATAFILRLGLHLIIKKTKIGRAMRAWAQDQIAAKLMGVDVNRVVSFTFATGSSLAGVAGILVAMY